MRFVAEPLLSSPVTNRVNWTLARLADEIAAREGVTKSRSPRRFVKRGFRYRRPRHTLKGRQDAGAVDRGGLRLKLFKAQAEAGDITLLFADESEALTHPYLARAWAKKGADLRVPAPGQVQKIATMGSLDYAQRKLIVTTSRTKRSADFIEHLQALDRLYGPRPGAPTKPVVLVLDNGPSTSAGPAGLLERARWHTVEWLRKYAPELNDIEIVWADLKTPHLAHQTFTDLDCLDSAIHHFVRDLHAARNRHQLDSRRMSPSKHCIACEQFGKVRGAHDDFRPSCSAQVTQRPYGTELRAPLTKRAYSPSSEGRKVRPQRETPLRPQGTDQSLSQANRGRYSQNHCTVRREPLQCWPASLQLRCL
jgi:transposase